MILYRTSALPISLGTSKVDGAVPQQSHVVCSSYIAGGY